MDSAIEVKLENMERDIEEIKEDVSSIEESISGMHRYVEERAQEGSTEHEIRLVKIESQLEMGVWVIAAVVIGVAIPFGRQLVWKVFNGKKSRANNGGK